MEIFNTFVVIGTGLFGILGIGFVLNHRVAMFIDNLIQHTPTVFTWRVGSICGSLGLLGQSLYSFKLLVLNDPSLPLLWYLKDIGIIVTGLSAVIYCFHICKSKKDLAKWRSDL